MASTTTWTSVPHDGPALSVWPGGPRYGPMDFAVLLWREKWLMLAAFLVVLGLGAGFAMTLKPSFTAGSSLLVQLGQEYVYEPRAGDAGRGAVTNTDGVVASETEILMGAALRERTLQRVGLALVYPKAAEEMSRAAPSERASIMAKAVAAMGKAMDVGASPGNPVVRVSFKHENPEVAARVLNAVLEEYLVYRRSVVIPPASRGLERQRSIFAERLAEADAAYQAFLTTNNLGDYAAQRSGLTQMLSQLESQKYSIEAQLQERAARLASLEGQLLQIAPEIGLSRDSNNSDNDRLAQLRLQREELLARYQPDAQPVTDLEAQIRQLESAIAQGRTQAPGARRFGINPVYQTLQTEKIQLASEIAALRGSGEANLRQIEQATLQLQRYAAIEPEFMELARDRDLLQSNVREFAIKEQRDEAAREIGQETTDNIRIVERARPPSSGSSLRKPVLLLSVMFAAFTALCLGLLRLFLRPGLPTAASASRTLGLPVLGAAPLKRR